MTSKTESTTETNDEKPQSDLWNHTPSSKESKDSVPNDSIILPMVRGLKVLVVGANKKRRERLARSLKKHQIKAFATTADEHGYRAALKFHPDVAISEMAKPGDPGWWLFKRFHRHPVLKWTPALLMKWWEEKDGKENILLKNVFERLMEALTPIRVLEERIAAGRKLNERVETTGMQPVITVICSAGLTGSLSVNDSWNIFEADIINGKIRSVFRRGVDGKENLGHPAFLQLLLTDNGHWTFRTHDSAARPKNVFLPLEGLFDWARTKLTLLFGPDVNIQNTQLLENLVVDRSMFHDVASTFNGLGRDLLEGIAAGASEKEIDSIIGDTQERIDAELAMITLVRSGAIYIKEQVKNLSEEERKVAKRVAYVLDWIAKDHQTEAHEEIKNTSPKRKTSTGFYSFSNPSVDQIKGDVQKYVPRKEKSDTVNLINDASWDPEREINQTPDDLSWRRKFSAPVENRISKFLGVVPKESLIPAPSIEERSKMQMWVAIFIALLLGTLLISGLVLIGADDPNSDSPDSIENQ